MSTKNLLIMKVSFAYKPKIFLLLIITFSSCTKISQTNEILESVTIDSTTITLHSLLHTSMHTQDIFCLIDELENIGFEKDTSTHQPMMYYSKSQNSYVEISCRIGEIHHVVYYKNSTDFEQSLNCFLQWSKQNRINIAWYNFQGKYKERRYVDYAKFLIALSNHKNVTPYHCYEYASDFYLNYTLTMMGKKDSYLVSYKLDYYEYK